MRRFCCFFSSVMILHIIFSIQAFAQIELPPYIKIGLFFSKTAVTEVVLTSSAGFEAGVWELDKLSSQKVVWKDKTVKIIKAQDASAITVTGEKDVVLYTGASADIPYTIMPIAENGEQKIMVNGISYRGGIQMKRQAESDMTVINVVSLEEYLQGVVPYELSASYPLEALKAQAVAARTYAVRNANKYQKLGFNLCNTTVSQVYKGTVGEHPRTNQAVGETKGKVITYGGKLISALFSASDGGYTEDSGNVWGGNEPYLKAVPDPYEVDVAYDKRAFEVEMTPLDIQKKLEAKGIDLGNILSLKIEAYTPAGRVLKLTICGDKGTKTLEKTATRDVLGLQSQKYDIVKLGGSTAFALIKTGEKIKGLRLFIGTKMLTEKGILDTTTPDFFLKLQGLSRATGEAPTKYRFLVKGNGHGVGLSQIGAVGMAQKGFTYEQILTYFYTGVKIES